MNEIMFTALTASGEQLDFWWTDWYPFTHPREEITTAVQNLLAVHKLFPDAGPAEVYQISEIICTFMDGTPPISMKVEISQ